MARCDHCGEETALPFTCQHCRGKFCAGCRLPPNHACTGIRSWNKKPRPAVSVNYGKGGGISVTGGGDLSGPRPGPRKNAGAGIPYLRIMIAVILLILAGFAWLVLTGSRIP